MEILKINELAKSYGDKKLFSNVSFAIENKSKIGLIGKNGVGKSTLLKILSGKEEQDLGNIIKPKDIKIGYLEQQPNYPTETVGEVLRLGFKEVYETASKMHDLEEKMSIGEGDLDVLIELYGKLQQKFELLGGYDVEYKINTVIQGFGLTDEFCEKKFSLLSGGQKTKVLLAKLLIESPQVILLDEPTNYLDLNSLKWLEEYVLNFEGAVIVVSHDRYFLDRTINEIIELNHEGVEEYNGNYSYYVGEKEKRLNEAQKDYELQQRDIKRMEDQIKWMQSTGSNVLKSKAHQIESRIEKMEKIEKPKVDNKKMRILLNGSISNKKRILELFDVSKSYDRQLFKNVNGTIIGSDNVGIIGDNGTGKTTLINMILGIEKPDDGIIRVGENLRIGYLDQESKFTDEDKTILETYCMETSQSETKARAELAKLMFTKDDVYKKISVLSGGEKKKLKLSILLASNPNLLILDEPTNHLDLPSREELEKKLLDFDGSILFVSHDRYFLNKIASKIWLLEPEGLTEVNGNYDDYCDYLSNLSKNQGTRAK